jgi:ribosomal protein S18 acetylase RimI-like enzyme
MPGIFAIYAPRSADQPATLPDGLHIAEATAEDIDGIATLIVQREGHSQEQAVEWARRWLASSGEAQRAFVARLNGQVVGYGRACLVQNQRNSPEPPVREGWYLMGVIVAEAFRRRGIGAALTCHRLAWIACRATEAFYFANSKNLASIDLHRRFGFEPIEHDFHFPGATFSEGGVGVLYRVRLHHQMEQR